MGRRPRHDPPGGWHHVMNRGAGRRTVFDTDDDRLAFEHRLGEVATHEGVEVHAYVLMGTHYHLLLHCPNARLSAAMQRLSSSYTRIVNDRAGRDGPLFRGRFHSVPVTGDRQLIATVAYIHRNPLDIAAVRALPAYRWSSLGVYLGRRRRPPWLTCTLVDSLLDREAHLAILADDAPRATVALSAADRNAEAEPHPTFSDVDGAIDVALGRTIVSTRQRRMLRLVLMSGDAGGWTCEQIADELGFRSTGAVRTALSRARRASAADPCMTAVLDRARRVLTGARL